MRLIDADALGKYVVKSKKNNQHIFERERLSHNIEHDHFIYMISMAPTIEDDDMVKVVRCRDCTHGSQYDDGSDNYVCGYGGTKKGIGFCSDGERRKENEDGVD